MHSKGTKWIATLEEATLKGYLVMLVNSLRYTKIFRKHEHHLSV